LQAILSVESYSEHPIGQAVVDGIREMDVKAVTVQNFAVLPGQGVRGTVNGAEYNIGTRALMRDLSIDYSGYDVAADKLESQGKTVFMIAEGTTLQGIIAVSDTVKEDSQVAIERLQADNIEVYMLTGDNRVTAGEIARQVGISENNIIAEVLPVDKAKVITILQESGHYVAMVGDGINDAPALIAADVGIAIGSGTEIAIEASDITLIHGSIKGVLDAITVSKRTLRNIKQNLFASLIYNILGIPLAAIGLLSPIIAGVAMSLSSVSVVLNSLRLKQIKLDK
jgi:Cu+-exporting ATPase